MRGDEEKVESLQARAFGLNPTADMGSKVWHVEGGLCVMDLGPTAFATPMQRRGVRR